MEVLSQIPDESIDLVLVDPPYMTTRFDYDIHAIDNFSLELWYKQILRVAKDTSPILIFAGNRFIFDMVQLGIKQFRYELHIS
jgi:DNA modification methylase